MTLQHYVDGFRMLDGNPVGLVHDDAAAQRLPPVPWFPPDTRRSVRRVLLHIIAETSHHAGPADITRQGLDRAKTRGRPGGLPFP